MVSPKACLCGCGRFKFGITEVEYRDKKFKNVPMAICENCGGDYPVETE